jgi:MFS family permease
MFRAALAGAPARRFFAAHAQSCLGTGLAYVALPLLAYDRFGTAWAVAAVLLPDLLPAILFGPLLGALVDRVGWRICAVVGDILRCLAFLVVLTADSLPTLIVGACLAGVGTALFIPAALAGLPRLLARDDTRAAGMGLFGAIDDLGLTAGPAVAAGALAFISLDALIAVNALTFAVSALLIAGIANDGGGAIARRATTLLADARAGIRELAGRPEIRTLLASSTGVVLCIGITTVGEVILAREVLGVSGSGLALMVAAGGLGTILGSLCTRFTTAGAWVWRRAYLIGLLAMSAELVLCGVLGSYWLVVPALALGGFGNGLALVHDRLLLAKSTPPELHGRLFALHKTCTSFAFAVSFLASGALIAALNVQMAFLASGVALTFVFTAVLSRLRAAWPSPTRARRASLSARGEIAQLVEHTTENRGVPGSSPGLAISSLPLSAPVGRSSRVSR